MRVVLKYGANREKVIKGLKRISKPGLRVYAGMKNCQKFSAGLVLQLFPHPRASRRTRLLVKRVLAAKSLHMSGNPLEVYMSRIGKKTDCGSGRCGSQD